MDIHRCVIIDDEPFTINWLKKYINSVPNLYLVNSYTNPLTALMDLSNSEPLDLILLDIDMPEITGIELSKEIRQKTRKLIFSTAHKQYGYEAFEAQADAYLLKPYTLSKFAATIAKLFPEKFDEPKPTLPAANDFFFVKNKNDNLKIVKVRFEEVVAVESKQNYVLIHTTSKQVLTYMSLTEIAKILSHFESFVQFQRSFIIQKDHIDTIDGNSIKMCNGLDITVGDYYRKDFTSFLSEKLIKTGRKT
jgi:DNA-binding LytR/AlgR family response regulator